MSADQSQPIRPSKEPIDLSPRSPMYPDNPPPMRDEQGRPVYPPQQQLPPGYGYPPPPQGKGNAMSKNMPVFLSFFAIIASVAISFLMISKFTPPMSLVDVQQGQINAMDAELHTANTGLIPRVETLINSMTNYVRMQDLSNYALKSDISGKADSSALNSLSTWTGTLEAQLKKANETITTLEATVATLKTDLKTVQDKLATPTVPAGQALTAKIQLQFGSYLVIPANTTTELQVPVRITVTNNSNVALTDVKLYVGFTPQSTYLVTMNWAAGYPAMVSSGTQWALIPGSGLAFQNGWGVNVSANSTATIQAMVTIKLATGLTADLTMVPEVTAQVA